VLLELVVVLTVLSVVYNVATRDRVKPASALYGGPFVYVDGKLVRTVDLRRSTFHARAAVYSKRWSTARTHMIKIVVLRTPGRSMVAIDGFGIVK